MLNPSGVNVSGLPSNCQLVLVGGVSCSSKEKIYMLIKENRNKIYHFSNIFETIYYSKNNNL